MTGWFRVGLRILAVAAGVMLTWGAAADPRGEVGIVRLPPDPEAMWSALLRPLPESYVAEEFKISGEADVFTYEDPPVAGQKMLRDDVETSYATRIMILRPPSPRDFNGTVVVEWWNSTAGWDTAPAADASIEYFEREGIIYVGVTNSPDSIEYLVGGCSLLGLLPPTCPGRYDGLSMPEIGQAFEMVSQIVTLLRSDAEDNPLADYRVQRLYHVGQSQQAGSVTTYANEFHFEGNDGYFIQAGGGVARQLSSDAPRFEEGQDGRSPRRDLPVPVIRAQTESDAIWVLASGTRQTDSHLFRYYEMAGTAHTPVHIDIPIIPGLLYLEDLCGAPLNTLADGPVYGSYLYNAMWHNMQRYSRYRIPLPHARPLEASGLDLERDEYGNSKGGIRLPAMQVPTATYGPSNYGKPVCGSEGAPPPPDCTLSVLAELGNLICRLSGTATPFEEETLDELYPTHRDYVGKVTANALYLRWRRFLLPDDMHTIIERAAESDGGAEGKCGRGFEVALVLPVALLLRRRRGSPVDDHETA